MEDSKKIESEMADHMASSSQTGKGFLTGPGLFEYPVDYVVIDGICIHEGCIELGRLEEVEAEAKLIREKQLKKMTFEAAGAEDVVTDEEQKGIGHPTDSDYLWENGLVPYTINNDVPRQERVTDAIKHIQENTAIKFVHRTAANAASYPNYVEIISNGNLGWSSSAIGMRGGRQVIRYSDRHSWQVLTHEFGHALGLQHEQCRSDRDNYVEIRWENIQESALGNFQKKPSSVDYFGYDYNSLMHYPRTSFAIDNSLPTIVPLQEGVTIGQREGLSFGDRQTIAKMYQRFFQRGYSGVWRQGTGSYGLWINANWTSFRNKWVEWSNQGLRLHDIYVRRSGSKTIFSGVYLPGSGAHGLWANVSWESFRNKWEELSNGGLRLVNLHIHRSNNQNRYSGVFLPGSGGYGLWVNASWSSFKNKWQEWSANGLRLVSLHVHKYDGKTRFSGAFIAGNGGHGLWANTSWTSFVNKWQQWNAQGLRLVNLNTHEEGNTTKYTGVFLPGNDSHYLWANVTYEGLIAKWAELAESDLRLIDFEFINREDSASGLDEIISEETDFQLDVQEFGGIYGTPIANEQNGQYPNLFLLNQLNVEAESGGAALGSVGNESENDEGQGNVFFDTQESLLDFADFGGSFFPE
ncbi:MAG: M12 family metallopeptidase [Saprospiraceae bacterium]|nr:M12 family metallopeptidase [Saprospiraceae bacterium]